MKNRGLLIRSTSLQHTVLALEKVRERFQGIQLDILTHPHAAESIRPLAGNGEILFYPYRESFGVRRLYTGGLLRIIKKKGYEIVVVPVENGSGIGYENVMALAIGVRPRKIVLCNRAGGIKIYSPSGTLWFLLKGWLSAPPAIILFLCLTIKWVYYVVKSQSDRTDRSDRTDFTSV